MPCWASTASAAWPASRWYWGERGGGGHGQEKERRSWGGAGVPWQGEARRRWRRPCGALPVPAGTGGRGPRQPTHVPYPHPRDRLALRPLPETALENGR